MLLIKNIWGALAAALSAFAGIRKSGDLPPNLRLWHFAAAGLAMVAVFILLLLAIVNAVV